MSSRSLVIRLLPLTALATVSMLLTGVGSATAAQLTTASVTMNNGLISQASVSYTFTASGVTLSTIKCIRVEFDTSADGTGGKPTGMTITSAALSGSSNYMPTPASWAISNDNANGVSSITYATGETPASASSRTVILTGITNGSTAENDFFVIVNTYNNTDCASSAVDNVTVGAIWTNSVAFTMTVDSSLAFAVAGVASGGSCATKTTTVTATATAVNFGRVTTGANQFAEQRFTVSTNAVNGYNVKTSFTQAPTSGGDTITWGSSPGSYGTPAAFPGAGNEVFAISTSDASVSSGGYNDTDKWTVINTTAPGDAFADATAPVASQTTDICYGVGVSGLTQTGVYTTTAVHTASGLF